MENMENNEIMTTEVVDEAVKAVSGKRIVKNIVGIGLGGVGGFVLAKFVVIPVVRKISTKIKAKKANRNHKQDVDEVDLEDMEVEDLPDLDE